jgi:hypothetical protein
VAHGVVHDVAHRLLQHRRRVALHDRSRRTA